jgi:hypothetical protein
MECQNWLLLDAAGTPAGYLRLPKSAPPDTLPDTLVINEVSRLSHAAALAALGHLKQQAGAHGKLAVQFILPADCTLMRLARVWGARSLTPYAWQIHMPDVTALLRALAPALERRLAGSPCAGLSEELRLCLYHQTLALRFAAGRLAAVTDLGFTDEETLRFPPLPFTQLILGYRSIDELRAAYPDVSVPPARRILIETLFPKVTGFIYTAY